MEEPGGSHGAESSIRARGDAASYSPPAARIATARTSIASDASCDHMHMLDGPWREAHIVRASETRRPFSDAATRLS